MEFIHSQKGAEHLLKQGYRYRRTKRVNDKEYWKCITCSATLVTHSREVTSENDHSHGPSLESNINFKMKNDLKRRAFNDVNRPVPQVYEEVARHYADEHGQFVGTLPIFSNVRTAMYKRRRTILPLLPQTREAIHVPNELRQINNIDFLIIDTPGENKILAFATDQNLRILSEASTIYGDGTFYAAPQLYTQIYTFHAMYKGTMLPLLYILLPSKTAAVYQECLEELDRVLARKGLFLNPRKVLLDYELAAHRAWLQMRPNIEMKGCLFHFCQTIWRKLQTLGLSVAYKDDMQFQQWERMILALPLLPIGDVHDTWLEIIGDAPMQQYPAVEEFVDYITNYWIDEESATFPIAGKLL